MDDYLQWQSDLSLEQVFASGESFAYPTPLANCDDFIYLTQLKQHGSRSVLMHCVRTQKGDYRRQCITPDIFQCRTKINEYGGKPFWLFDDNVVFANQNDQCLYRQKINAQSFSAPQRISCLSDHHQYMYADVCQLDQRFLLAIVECADLVDTQNENHCHIALIDTRQADMEPVFLQSGSDFYCNLVVDLNTCKLAWVQWQHPFMPWDSNTLMMAELYPQENTYELRNPQKIDLAPSASSAQLCFARNGDLYFVADFADPDPASISFNKEQTIEPTKNYWNVYAYIANQKTVRQITFLEAEFAYPHWQYGDHRLCQNSATTLLAIASKPDEDTLYQIDSETDYIEPLAQQKGLQGLLSGNAAQNQSSTVLTVQHHHDRPSNIARIDSHQLIPIRFEDEGNEVDAGISISEPQHIHFTTRDSSTAYGFYYAPHNERYQNNGPAPLIVMVHGGPTSRAYAYFDLQKQFWTTRGFALLDINHRGSCGYGRLYRDALYGQWGDLDASDIVDGVTALVEKGLVDPDKVCIRGKSAGGYAVLRALTEYPKVFRAGACYYGIGNLVTLAETTHKFEKYYTDRLVGETYNAQNARKTGSAFYQRSPINQIHQIDSAMIIFQGSQDKIVPPSVAKEMVEALDKAGLAHSYSEYSDEGHGFKQVSNNIDAWSKELSFYRHVLTRYSHSS